MERYTAYVFYENHDDEKDVTVLPKTDGAWVLHSEAQAEIDLLTAERDRARDEAKAERLVQGALRQKAEAERDHWKAYSSGQGKLLESGVVIPTDEYIALTAERDTAWNDSLHKAAKALEDAGYLQAAALVTAMKYEADKG